MKGDFFVEENHRHCFCRLCNKPIGIGNFRVNVLVDANWQSNKQERYIYNSYFHILCVTNKIKKDLKCFTKT